MGTLTPFHIIVTAQDGAEGQETSAGVLQRRDEPLLAGADTTLWVGFAAFISIFLIVMVAIIRARVIKPAERAARASDFFEPAGAGADITFDDPAQAQIREIKKARKKKRAEKASRTSLDREEPTDVEPEDANASSDEPEDISATDPQMAEIAAAIDNAQADEKDDDRGAPFAGLFDREDRPAEDEIAIVDVEVETPVDNAAMLAEPPSDVHIGQLPEVDENYWDTERQQRETEAEYQRAEDERRIALEEADRARADADEAHRRLDAERELNAREAAAVREENDKLQGERLQALSEMQGKLDAMADRLARDADTVETRIGAAIEKKFAGLSDDLQGKLSAATVEMQEKQTGATAADRQKDHDSALMIANHLSALQKATESALSGLADRLDALSAARAPETAPSTNNVKAEQAAPAVAGPLQLNDLVRSALPAGRYSFDRRLSNGANADCVVTGAGKRNIAIDAGFPVEAFDRYARADNATRDHAATAYRRAVLRHMIFVAEKLIAPAETTDFAILFVPNDTIFNDLHQNFADIIQDSYRARIWAASPTSLMATLHMMNAVVHGGDENGDAKENALAPQVSELLARIDALEEKISVLETAPRAKAPPRPETVAQTNAPLASSVAEIPEGDEAEIEIITAEASPAEQTSTSQDEDDGRPAFPLR